MYNDKIELMAQRDQPSAPESLPGTLGSVLYGDPSAKAPPEHEWVMLVASVAGGDQLALHALYARAHRLVFTLAMRITGSRESAEEVTVDVFHDVWRRASAYDPVNGPVLGWIMNQARSRAIDRLRFERRKKRSGAEEGEEVATIETCEPDDRFEKAQEGQLLRRALAMLTAAEQEAIEAAFFGELSHAEVAAQLNQPLGTVKTRIRSGLSKLRQAMAAEGRQR